MILPDGLDLTHLSEGPDFVASLLDAEAWETFLAPPVSPDTVPLNTIAHGAQSTVGNHETR